VSNHVTGIFRIRAWVSRSVAPAWGVGECVDTLAADSGAGRVLVLKSSARQTNSALPDATKDLASDHRRIRMSPSFPSMAPSASVPRPSTTESFKRRMKTAVSRSGESIMLIFPAVSFRFCSCGGKEARKDER